MWIKTGRVLACVCLLLTLATAVPGQNIAVTAFTDNKKVGLEDTFVYSIKVQGPISQNAPISIKTPDFADFEVLSSSDSSSFSLVNGRMSKGITRNYILQAKKTGTLTITGGQVSVDQQKFTVKDVQVEVVKGSVAPRRSRRRALDPFADPFERMDSLLNRSRRPRRFDRNDAFVKLSLSQSKPYIYQQVVFTLSLYKKSYVQGEVSLDPPDLKEFWVEELDREEMQEAGYTTYNNEQYIVNRVHYVIYPTRTGEIKIPPVKVHLSPLSAFWGRPRALTSNSVTLNVKPLPVKGNLPVGRFTLRSGINGDNLRQNEPFTLEVAISGNGVLNEQDLPKLVSSETFEIYPPKTTQTHSFRDGRMTKSWKYEYILIPLESGELQVPAHTFRFFSPARQQVVTQTLGGQTIDVAAAPGGRKPTAGQAPEAKLIEHTQSLRYLMPFGGPEKPVPVLSFVLPLAVGLLFLPLVCWLVLLALRKHEAGHSLRLARKSARSAIKRIRRSGKTADAREQNRACLEALYRFIDERFSISCRSLTQRELTAFLAERGLKEDTAQGLAQSIQELQSALYDPQAKAGSLSNETQARLAGLILAADKEAQA